MKNTLHGTGYDPEELYFEKVNRELINKIKLENSTATGGETQEGGQVIPFPSRKGQETQKKAA